MILCIDAGNSRVKWGWHDGQQWTSIATVSLIEFAASSDHINPFSVTHEAPERIVISNVAGEGAHQLLVNWTSIFDAEPLWLRAAWERMDAHAGKRLRVRLADGRVLTGVARGLDGDGGLRLQTRSGLRAVRSGRVLSARPA